MRLSDAASLVPLLPWLVAAGLASSAPGTDPPAAAIVSGRVIAAASPSTSIAGAHLTLSSDSLTRTTSSDPDGRFLFEGLAPGRYVLTASKAGYADFEFGAFRGGEPGTRLAIQGDARHEGLVLALSRLGAITGTVRESTGRLVANVPVAARDKDGTVAQRATTDDLGRYRLLDLSPGVYYVSAAPQTSLIDPAGPVFAPGTVDPARASLITMADGATVDAVDVLLPPRGTAAVAGRVVFADGRPAQRARVRLVTSLDIVRAVRTDANGRFALERVAAGAYTVRAIVEAKRERGAPMLPLAPPAALAEQSIQVADGAETLLELTPGSGATLTGRVRFEGAAPPARAVVTVRRIDVRDTERRVEVVDGQFTVKGLAPGRYRMTCLVPEDRHWWLAAAEMNGKDVLLSDLELTPDQVTASVLLTLSRSTAELGGFLSDAAGAPAIEYWIAVVPADRRFWHPRSPRLARVRPATDGRYQFTNLPAGDYIVAAFGDLGTNDWRSVSILDSLAASGVRVTLPDGGAAEHSFRIPR